MLGVTRIALYGGNISLGPAILLDAQTFTNTGNGITYEVPDGTTYIDFEIWGAGGGGGGRYSTGSGRGALNYSGGGGGGGGYAQHRYTPTSPNSFASNDLIFMNIGSGGAGGKWITYLTQYPGQTGSASVITEHKSSAELLKEAIYAGASGGQGGLSSTTPNGGAGGQGYGNIYNLQGSNGTNGGSSVVGGDGGNGASGGAGGAGALIFPATAAVDGTQPGGGGGGAHPTDTTLDDGADGGDGQIVVRAYGYTP